MLLFNFITLYGMNVEYGMTTYFILFILTTYITIIAHL